MGDDRDRRRASDEDLPNLPVARAAWTPRPALRTSAEYWLEANGLHYTVLSTQVPLEALAEPAEMVRIELAPIGDANTRAFRRQLRWAVAHHRLLLPR